MDDFVYGRLGSEDWGTWGENVASWIYTRGWRKELLLLRYKDMLKDTMSELGRIARFLGIDAEPSRIGCENWKKPNTTSGLELESAAYPVCAGRQGRRIGERLCLKPVRDKSNRRWGSLMAYLGLPSNWGKSNRQGSIDQLLKQQKSSSAHTT